MFEDPAEHERAVRPPAGIPDSNRSRPWSDRRSRWPIHRPSHDRWTVADHQGVHPAKTIVTVRRASTAARCACNGFDVNCWRSLPWGRLFHNVPSGYHDHTRPLAVRRRLERSMIDSPSSAGANVFVAGSELRINSPRPRRPKAKSCRPFRLTPGLRSNSAGPHRQARGLGGSEAVQASLTLRVAEFLTEAAGILAVIDEVPTVRRPVAA